MKAAGACVPVAKQAMTLIEVRYAISRQLDSESNFSVTVNHRHERVLHTLAEVDHLRNALNFTGNDWSRKQDDH